MLIVRRCGVVVPTEPGEAVSEMVVANGDAQELVSVGDMPPGDRADGDLRSP